MHLARLHRLVVHRPADRDGLLDPRPQPREVTGQVVGRQRRAHRGHAAPDVHPHGGRAHGPVHRDDGPDRGALPVVHVGHDGEPLDPRQRRHVLQLPQRRVLHGRRIGPHPDRHPRPGHLDVTHGSFHSPCPCEQRCERPPLAPLGPTIVGTGHAAPPKGFRLHREPDSVPTRAARRGLGRSGAQVLKRSGTQELRRSRAQALTWKWVPSSWKTAVFSAKARLHSSTMRCFSRSSQGRASRRARYSRLKAAGLSMASKT